MSELYFVPTPNWFISKPLDIYENKSNENDKYNGLVALSVIGSIHLTNSRFNEYYGCIKDAHTKRLNSLVFYQKPFDALEQEIHCLLASCGEDLDVKVWNTDTKTCQFSHKLHQSTPSCLDWLYMDDGLVLISGDVKGNVFKWNAQTNEHVRYFPDNKPITQIKTCRNEHITAVGYRHGTIVILNVKTEQMKILFKLKLHTDAINYLYWNPVDKQASSGNSTFLNDSPLILCSSSEDKTIRFWSIENDGSQLFMINAPGSSDTTTNEQNGQASKMPINKISYTALYWPSQHCILSASYSGDLYALDLKDIRREGESWLVKWQQLKGTKPCKKVIYDINCYQNTIVTLSLDKLICTWCLDTLKQEACMSTINGYIYSIINSPVDPNTYAMAVGDSTIKIFNEKQNEKYFKSFSNNIKTEITQIAWHPAKETIIGFGTKDGKVGVIDISSPNRPAQYIYSDYNQSVYTLVWAQNLLKPNQQSEPYCLYSVADGKVLQHAVKITSNKLQHSQTVNFYTELKTQIATDTTIDQCGLTELAVFSHGSSTDKVYFTIGKFDGSIELYCTVPKSCAKHLCTFLNHNKLITIIKWNKSGTLIASGSNDTNIVIIDFANLVNDFINNNEHLKFVSRFRHKLIGHKERITGLNWSGFDESLLVSCSYDATVQVWNALEGTAIANYRSHSDKILCCIFSNNNSNLIYSGGEDYALHCWRVDKQEFTSPPDECQILLGKRKKQFYKKVNRKEAAPVVTTKDDQVEVQLTRTDDVEKTEEASWRRKEEHVLEQQTKPKASKQSQLHQQANITNLLKDPKAIFTHSTRANRTDNIKPLKECLALFEKLYESTDTPPCTYDDLNRQIEIQSIDLSEDQLNLSLLCNRKSTVKLLKYEQELNEDRSWLFDIWKGNIEHLMSEMAKKSQINDFYMTIYQLATQNVSTGYVNSYCEQLIENGDYHKAALYQLASYNISGAIEIYLRFHQYQCALCLAQLRLNKNDELFKKILLNYAVYTKINGDFETSVLIYIRLCDLSNALNVLNRRTIVSDEQKTLFDEIIKKFSKIDSTILC